LTGLLPLAAERTDGRTALEPDVGHNSRTTVNNTLSIRRSENTVLVYHASAQAKAMNIPLSDIYVDAGAIDAVSRVLASKRYILGDETAKFESEFAQKLGTRYAVAVSSGTAALFLSMLASKLEKGDEVLVPSFSFIASASPIVDVGAEPVFCDVDPETLTIDPRDIREKITRRTKAIIPVHLFGHPANMDEIAEIAEAASLQIIED